MCLWCQSSAGWTEVAELVTQQPVKRGLSCVWCLLSSAESCHEPSCGMCHLRLIGSVLEWILEAQKLLVFYLGFGDLWAPWGTSLIACCLRFGGELWLTVSPCACSEQQASLVSSHHSRDSCVSPSYQICYQHRIFWQSQLYRNRSTNQTNKKNQTQIKCCIWLQVYNLKCFF